MNQILCKTPPRRLFAFGCSFTDYKWASWANILAKELAPDEFINCGKSGAGNQYIFNIIMQADALYNFTQEDLVVVQWTNVRREDRYLPQEGTEHWVTPGNIYSQHHYDKKFIKKYFSDKGAYIRDLAAIKATYELLKHKTQWHFLQMCDIIQQPDQWNYESQHSHTSKDQQLDQLIQAYSEPLSHMKSSFYDILWNNDTDTKFAQDRKLISEVFFDGHPSPIEHFEYLKRVFDHKWKDTTCKAVQQTQNTWVRLLRDASADKKYFNICQSLPSYQHMFYLETILVASDPPSNGFIR